MVERIILRGAEPEYADAIPLFSVAQGRFISRFDEEHSRPVVVLGAAIADSLFGQPRSGREDGADEWPASMR